MLFSDAVDIDHILPFASTLDDSNGNKIVCMREANRTKRKRSPYEAWGHTAQWEEIAARSEEHTSELQSLMRISYAVFCLKKKKETTTNNTQSNLQTTKNKTK